MFLHEKDQWFRFSWDDEPIIPLLSTVRNRQGRLWGRLSSMGFELQDKAELEMRSLDVLKSSEIEGVALDPEVVRSSIARSLGLEYGGFSGSTHDVDAVVEMTLDATYGYATPLTEERLFTWHAALFPTGYSGLHKISLARYRDDEMEVVSGPIGREKVHYRAPAPERVPAEMARFLAWFNSGDGPEEVLRAAIAHFWFVSIHPFDDGNGRIARALTDMVLARSDASPRRFYSMSNQILVERKAYYEVLESTQKGSGEISEWLIWFLSCLDDALVASETLLDSVMRAARFWQGCAMIVLSDRQRKVLRKLLDGFDGKLTSSKWRRITKTSQDTALRDIQDLIAKGVLERESSQGRSTSYRIAERWFAE
ncbi:MAG: Fic family protein [Coriobacteriales bacterium]|nr:Fic family protein [Coriobacteriales bacterium]